MHHKELLRICAPVTPILPSFCLRTSSQKICQKLGNQAFCGPWCIDTRRKTRENRNCGPRVFL